MNSKIKAIFSKISHSLEILDKERISEIKELIEEYIYYEQTSPTKLMTNQSFYKELSSLIERVKYSELLDLMYSFFCGLVDFSLIKESNYALIIFNFSKAYINVNISSKCTRILINYFLPEQGISSYAYIERYLFLKKQIGTNYDLPTELTNTIQNLVLRMKHDKINQYHFNLIIMLLQSILQFHHLAFNSVKELICNYSSFSQIQCDNLFKLLYRLNDNIIGEINLSLTGNNRAVSKGKYILNIEILNKFKLSNEIKSFIYVFLPEKSKNLNNLFNFLSIHLAEIILLCKKLLEVNFEFCKDFSRNFHLGNLNQTINNLIDSISSEKDIQWIMRTYGKLYNISKFIGDISMEQYYISKIKSIYQNNCFVGNETFLIYVTEFKEIVRSVSMLESKIKRNDKLDSNEKYEEMKVYLDDIIFILNNISFVEEEDDYSNFDIIVEKLNNTVDCLYLHFSTGDYYSKPLKTNVKFIINKFESLYSKFEQVYQNKIFNKNNKKKKLLNLKITENYEFYKWMNRLICYENNSQNFNEKEVINLFVSFSLGFKFQYNESLINNLRIRSVLVLCMIQFEHPEFLKNFLNVFSIKSEYFPTFLLIIDEFFNILHVDNLLKKLPSTNFAQILRIIVKSINNNQMFISNVKQLQEKIENKIIRFIYNFFCNIDIRIKDLYHIINNTFLSFNESSNLINLDKFKSTVECIVYNTISLKILNNLVENELMTGDCEQILLNLINNVESSKIVNRFQIFYMKILKNNLKFEHNKQLAIQTLLFELHSKFLIFDSTINAFSKSLDNKFCNKYKEIEESLDRGLIIFYKFQKIFKHHPVSKSDTFHLFSENWNYNKEDTNFFPDRLLELSDIYNLSFLLGDETTPKRIINIITRYCTNYDKIKIFLLMNFHNEMMLDSLGKYKLSIDNQDMNGIEIELNKLQGKLNISEDVNDYNNIRDIMILIEIYNFYSLQSNKEFKRNFPFIKKLKEIFHKILTKKKQQTNLSKIEVILFLKILYCKLLKHYKNCNFSYFLSNSYYFLQSSLPSLKALVASQKSFVNLINYHTQSMNLIKDNIDNKDLDSDDFQKKINHLIFCDDTFLISITVRMLKKIVLFFLKICKKFGQYDKFLETVRTIYDYKLLHLDNLFLFRLNSIIAFSFKGILNENIITIFNKNIKDKNFISFLIKKYFKMMDFTLRIKDIKQEKYIIFLDLAYKNFIEKMNKFEFTDINLNDDLISYIRNFLELTLNPHFLKNGFYLKNEYFHLFLFCFKIFKYFWRSSIDNRSTMIELTNYFYNASSIIVKNVCKEQYIFLEDIYCIQLDILSLASKSRFELLFRQYIIPNILYNRAIEELLAKGESEKMIKFYLLFEDNYISLLKSRKLVNFLHISKEYKPKIYMKKVLESLIDLGLSNNIMTEEMKELITYYENYINVKNEVLKYVKFSQKYPSVFNLSCIRKSLDFASNDICKRYSDSKEKHMNSLFFYRIKDYFVFYVKSDGETAFNIIPANDILVLKKEFSEKIEKEIIEFQEIKVKENWFKKLSQVEKNIENFFFILQKNLINDDIRKILANIYSKSAKFLDFINEFDILNEINQSSINDFLYCFVNLDRSDKLDRHYQGKLFKKDLQISLKKFYNDFFIVNKIDGFINEQPFKFFISSELNNLPIENIPILYNLMILRVNDKAAIKPKNFKLTIKEMNEICYLVNPGEEMLKLNNVQKSFLKQKFHNLYENRGNKNEADLKEEISNRIKDNCKLYFYCGHSTGKKFFKTNFWKETKITFPAFLLGCSSVNIKNKFYNSSSLVDFVSFLLMNDCPYICGNLWDVTDKDMDIYAIKIVEIVFSKRSTKSFYDAHFIAKKEMKSKFLNRAAMVIFGNDVIINT